MALLGVKARSKLPPCCEEGAVAFEQLQSKGKWMAEPYGRDQGYQSFIQLVMRFFFVVIIFFRATKQKC